MHAARLCEPFILLVDDDEDSRIITARLLARAGMTHPVVSLHSGEAAIAYLRDLCPTNGAPAGVLPVVLLLDIHMPQVTGFDVLRWVKRESALGMLKVVMWSTSDREEDYRQARELKADAYLIKFPSPPVLAATLRACLAEPKATSSAPVLQPG